MADWQVERTPKVQTRLKCRKNKHNRNFPLMPLWKTPTKPKSETYILTASKKLKVLEELNKMVTNTN